MSRRMKVRLSHLFFQGLQRQETCPADIRRNAPLFAGFRCQMAILGDKWLQPLIPAHPCDVIPDVTQLLPITGLYVPRGYGTLATYRATRYPEVAYAWVCGRAIHDCVTIDRFRPASAGGLYGWDNVGVLCPSCQRFKWQFWPWLDYRPTNYKRQIEAYLQEKYGRQLWLGEDEKGVNGLEL